MPEPTNEWTIGVGHLVTRVRRRWRVVLGTTVVVLAATAAAGVLLPHQYTATASVAVSPIRNAATYGTQPININTERAVLASREVAVLASQALHGSVSAAELAAASTAAAPSGSEVLQVSVAAPRPRDSAAWANAIATAYLQFRAQGALQSAQPSIEALQARIASVNPSNTSMLSDLRSQLVALQHSGEGTGRMIGRATAPTSSSSLGLQVYLIGGFIGGQKSAAALSEIDAFLAHRPGLPLDLRQKILQTRDDLERTVRIRAKYAGERAATSTVQ